MSACKLALILLCLGLFLYGQAACRRSSSPPPTRTTSTPDPNKVVDDILAKYTSAVGGQEAIDGVKSFSGKGAFAVTALNRTETGAFEVWGKDPSKTLSVITFPRGIVIRHGFDGQTRWFHVPRVGVLEQEGPAEMAEVERNAEIYEAGEIKKLYATMRSEGKARLNKRDVDVIEGKPEKGPSDKLFFDTESGLLVRWDMVRRNPKRGNLFVKVHLDDYRDINGVKIPFKVRFNFESVFVNFRLDELTHNVALDDAMFQKP